MRYDPISRRFFLQGATGTLMAVPFLSSLAPRASAAAAKADALAPLTNIVFLKQLHAGAFTNVRAPETLAWQGLGNGMRRAPLPADFSQFGPSYAQTTKLAPLRDKICHIIGPDLTNGYGLHEHGNNCLVNGNPHWARVASVDQVIAAKIYGADAPVIATLNAGTLYGAGSGRPLGGDIQEVPVYRDPIDLWRLLFQSFETTADAKAKADLRDRAMMDRVRADYKSVLASGRLSSGDKLLLEKHAELISDFDRRLAARKAVQCQPPAAPSAGNEVGYYYPDIAIEEQLDMIAAALACGMTRVAMHYLFEGHVQIIDRLVADLVDRYTGDKSYHQSVAHGISVGTATIPRDAAKAAAAAIDAYYLDHVAGFANRLRAYSEDLLDSTAIVYGREFGTVVDNDPDVHTLNDLNILIVGGGKAFNSGYAYDLKTSTAPPTGMGWVGRRLVGLPYNDMLYAYMTAMGLKPADWETAGESGFGVYTSVAGIQYVERDRRSPPPGLLRADASKL